MTQDEKIDLLAEKMSKLDPLIINGFLTHYLQWKAEREPDLFKRFIKN